MLRARSVAIVGASDRVGTVGNQTVRQLLTGGFDGQVYPVNPGYEQIAGLDCYPDIGSIDAQIDVAVLAVANSKLEDQVESAITAGAGSLVIYASCHGSAADGTSLRSRLTSLVNHAGVPVCGGNGMGFVNIEDRLRLTGFFQPPGLSPGGVCFLTHSGSLFSAMLHTDRGLGFNLVVSTGLEMNVTMSDYLEWAIDQESTRVVALFMETVRDPTGFRAALERADDNDIAVVALTVGHSRRGKAAVATHSEAIAGDDAGYEAVFDEHGVHRVSTMDEMVDTVELLSSSRRPHRGGLGAVHDSGGERTLLIDTAERLGVPLPMVGDETSNRLAALLDTGLEPQNPVDAWGTGHAAEDVFAGCLMALADDPGIGVVAFSVDLTSEEDLDNAYGIAVLHAASKVDKPIAVLANVSSTVDADQAAMIRKGGVPVLQGTETGLRAIGHLIDRAGRGNAPAREDRLTSSVTTVKGVPAIELLAAYGIPFASTRTVSDLDSATAAAERIGYPVVLKTAGEDHKTEVEGIRLNLRDAAGVELAYRDLSSRLGPQVTVSEQVPAGVEVALGMVTDAHFGPLVVVAAGGTLVELLEDRAALLPPVDQPRATRALDRLAVSRLLSGSRGSPPADMSSLTELIVRFSELVLDHGTELDAVDLNPVIAGPERSVAVDVLVRWRS
ncbi:MAG TPA: acetate--CoA ligase family protein [Acidimicrobiia bacterium]|nr:acetate--CoA ligase family protein [Acidimicrobiia bacterium]